MVKKSKTPDDYKPELLAAVLPHVPFDGWTHHVLDLAADEVGIERDVARLAFPKGVNDLVAYFLEDANERMSAAMEAADMPSMKIRERIIFAIRTRLEQNFAYKEAIRRAFTLLAMPQNASLALTSGYATVDAMWKAAGDNSTDFNYYTKRATLAGVYTSTLMVWLGDETDDHAETWAFLDRRIDNIMQIEKVKAKGRDACAKLPDIPAMLGKMRYGG